MIEIDLAAQPDYGPELRRAAVTTTVTRGWFGPPLDETTEIGQAEIEADYQAFLADMAAWFDQPPRTTCRHCNAPLAPTDHYLCQPCLAEIPF